MSHGRGTGFHFRGNWLQTESNFLSSGVWGPALTQHVVYHQGMPAAYFPLFVCGFTSLGNWMKLFKFKKVTFQIMRKNFFFFFWSGIRLFPLKATLCFISNLVNRFVRASESWSNTTFLWERARERELGELNTLVHMWMFGGELVAKEGQCPFVLLGWERKWVFFIHVLCPPHGHRSPLPLNYLNELVLTW